MKTTISTDVSIVVQKQEREGDVTGLPVITLKEKHIFDTDAQAESFREQLDIWLKEFPHPNGDMQPFPKRKAAPTEAELFRILDDFHGPAELWHDVEPAEDNLDVPKFMRPRPMAERSYQPDEGEIFIEVT